MPSWNKLIPFKRVAAGTDMTLQRVCNVAPKEGGRGGWGGHTLKVWIQNTRPSLVPRLPLIPTANHNNQLLLQVFHQIEQRQDYGGSKYVSLLSFRKGTRKTDNNRGDRVSAVRRKKRRGALRSVRGLWGMWVLWGQGGRAGGGEAPLSSGEEQQNDNSLSQTPKKHPTQTVDTHTLYTTFVCVLRLCRFPSYLFMGFYKLLHVDAERCSLCLI